MPVYPNGGFPFCEWDPGDLWFGLYCNMLLRQHVNDEQNPSCTYGQLSQGTLFQTCPWAVNM